jgi:hypothetical protein
MDQGIPAHEPQFNVALAHLEDEIKMLEGVSGRGRTLRIGALVLSLAAIVGAIVWFVARPPGM